MNSQPTLVHGRIRLKRLDPGYGDDPDKDDTRKIAENCGQRIGELQDLL